MFNERHLNPEHARERAISRLNELAKSLGFNSTAEMDLLTKQYSQGASAELHNQWRDLAEQLTEQDPKGEAGHRLQVGMQIQELMLFLRSDEIDRFLNGLDQVILVAKWLNLVNTVNGLEEVGMEIVSNF